MLPSEARWAQSPQWAEAWNGSQEGLNYRDLWRLLISCSQGQDRWMYCLIYVCNQNRSQMCNQKDESSFPNGKANSLRSVYTEVIPRCRAHLLKDQPEICKKRLNNTMSIQSSDSFRDLLLLTLITVYFGEDYIITFQGLMGLGYR